ncbi:unnamed protein product [Cylindrotheca closterium]|uniref:5'-deoxynucleotidase n=1 Tax=Cylindrotheca closterium TaxID=2856 RepID=A0AAD2CRC8_9STRA|nr:unnamed protein product [Cylindrotheca closterium]
MSLQSSGIITALNAAASEPATPASRVIDFLTISRGLKTQERTGWVRQEANPKIESIADHSWRITLMAMIAGFSAESDTSDESSSIDTNKCIQMALVHDLAEATVGDITPYCGVSDQDKHQMELDAMTKLTTGLLGTAMGAERILSLWKEYEQGTTEEAKLVKDMDKLEMILQALEYEQDGENKKSLDGFFDSTRGKWRTKIGEAWGKEIESRRQQKEQEQAAEKRKRDDEKETTAS